LHWKVWALLSTLTWAAWGVAVKYAIRDIGWQRLEILSALAGLILMFAIAPGSFQIKPDGKHLFGLLAGGLGALGAILFYLALSTGPVSVIIPLTSLYVVGVAIAGVALFGEPVTIRKVIGIGLALAAMVVLSGEE